MTGAAKVGPAGQRRAVFAAGEDAALAAAARLARFRAAHPDVPVLLLGACPMAWAVGQKIEYPTLCGLPGALKKIVRPDAHTSHTGTPQ